MGGAACGLAGELCLGENASKSRGAVGRAADLGLILVKWSWFPSSLIVRPCEKWGRRGGSRTCPSFQRLWSGRGGGLATLRRDSAGREASVMGLGALPADALLGLLPAYAPYVLRQGEGRGRCRLVPPGRETRWFLRPPRSASGKAGPHPWPPGAGGAAPREEPELLTASGKSGRSREGSEERESEVLLFALPGRGHSPEKPVLWEPEVRARRTVVPSTPGKEGNSAGFCCLSP